MLDLAHQFGSDLSVSATGDIAISSGPALTRDRLLRRLLTNPGAYIWRLGYGAGLGRYVGRAAPTLRLHAVMRAQVLKERAVARSPAPVVRIDAQPSGITTATISYGDATTGAAQTLSTVF